MKKTVLKLISIGLCLIFALGLMAACGNKAEGTYVIGATGPLTGDAASYGQSVQNGAKLAVEEINALDGDIKFTFYMVDDEAKASNIDSAYSTLLSKGMVASIGSVTSGSCIAFAEKSKADNLFFITPSASADDAIANPNGYRICFGDPDQGKYAAQNLLKEYQKIGVIYNIDDSYSTGLLGGFETEMAAQGKTDAYVKQNFSNSANTSFATQVTALKNAGCDVVFLPIYYQEASLIIAEAAKNNYDVDFYGCDGMDGIVKHASGNATLTEQLKGLRYLAPIDVNSTDAKIKSFVDAYKKAYNETPDQFAADAYDAIYVIYEAMKKAEINDVNISRSDFCNKITAVLQGDFEYVGVTGTMTWDENGAAVKPPVVIEVK